MAHGLTKADVDAALSQHRPPANWRKWAHCAKAELWQCVALSCGVEPVDATMRMVPVGATQRGASKSRPWFAEHGDMRERLDIALANAGLDVLSKLRPLPDKSGDMASRIFSTAEFGMWARSIWGAGVPAEFPDYQPTTVGLTIAAEPPPVVEATVTTVEVSGPDVESAVVTTDTPLPLTTSDIALCFDGLRWRELAWKKSLGNKPKWLRTCVAISGQRGVSETRWNPVLIGAALVRDGHARPNSVRARFQTKPRLKPWLDAWKTYEAEYLDNA